jgi:hypothetical protein
MNITSKKYIGYAEEISVFTDSIKSALFEFNKYLDDSKADYIILMARSAARLFEVISLAGGRIPDSVILYNTCLDHDLSFLEDRKVIIADDTLICGTTLFEAKNTVESAGASHVETVVLLLDTDWHVSDLIIPDKAFVSTDSQRVLEFCAHEVDAFSNAGIPYVTDFPVTRPCHMNIEDIDAILQLSSWNCHLLSNQNKEDLGAFSYTYLPTDGIWARSPLLSKYKHLIDIVKIRMFYKSRERNRFIRFVPIITFFPLSSSNLNVLLDEILYDLNLGSEDVIKNFRTSSSKLRFCQYALSSILGSHFVEDIEKCLEGTKHLSLDLEEAARIFGHQLSPQISRLHQFFEDSADEPKPNESCDISKASTPDVAKRLLDTDLDTFFGNVAKPPTEPDELDAVRNIYTDINAIFSNLYTHYELPARLEAKRLGKKIFEMDDDAATHRGRLKVGLPWDDMMAHLCRQEGLGPRRSRSQVLSLMLDRLVDLGVAVPIIAEADGVVFRAYRHGETVPITNEFLLLVYEMAEQFLKANGRADIPRLTFEKILVALVRIGIATDFIQSSSIEDSFEDKARVDYYQHGAVVVLGGKDLLFADGEAAFVSTYLTKRGILTRTTKAEGRRYLLGKRPDAAVRKPVAPTNARQIGFLFGKMCRSPESDGAPVLDEEGLTAIATCVHPRDLSGAILALVKISIRWIDENYEYLECLDGKEGKEQEAFLKDLPRSPAYQAVNSAYLKAKLYSDGAAKALVQKGADFLRSEFDDTGHVLADSWAAYWDAVTSMTTDDEREFFEGVISKLLDEIVRLAISIFFVEVSLAAKNYGAESGELKKVKKRVRTFLENVSPFTSKRLAGSKGFLRLSEVVGEKYIDFGSPTIFDRSVERLISAGAHANSISRVCCDEMNEYGRASPRTDYQFVIWYDVINSMTEKFCMSDHEKSDYRRRVKRFRHNVAPVLDRMIRRITRSRKFNCSISSNPPSIEDADDEKTILLAGQRAEHFTREISEVILKQAQACGVEIRMVAINANFAGRPPFRYHGRTAIIGTVFWEYFSRVKRAVEQWEDRSTGAHRPPASHFWRGDQLAIDNRKVELDFVSEEEVISCRIENDGRSLELELRGGLID